jgi:hypothetical protein
VFERVDAVIRPWEDFWKHPSGITSRQWLPEFAAYLLELPIDAVSEPFAAKVSKGLAGLLLSVLPQHVGPLLAREWTTRDTEDLQAIGKHFAAEMLDPRPEDLVKIAEAISEMRAGITFGDWTRIAKAFGVKSPEEIKAAWDNAVAAWTKALGIPAPAPAAPPTAPPMTRETLASPPATLPTPPVFRMTSDTFQPSAPAVPKMLFKTTLS